MEWIVFMTCIQAIEMIVGKTDSVRFDKLCPLNTLLTPLTQLFMITFITLPYYCKFTNCFSIFSVYVRNNYFA